MTGKPTAARAGQSDNAAARVDPAEFFGSDTLQDPYPVYDRMRAEAPVHRIGDSEFYAVCGWDAVIDAVNRVEDFFFQPHCDHGVSR